MFFLVANRDVQDHVLNIGNYFPDQHVLINHYKGDRV